MRVLAAQAGTAASAMTKVRASPQAFPVEKELR